MRAFHVEHLLLAVLLGGLVGCADEVTECRDKYLRSNTCAAILATFDDCGWTGVAETGASGEDIEALVEICL